MASGRHHVTQRSRNSPALWSVVGAGSVAINLHAWITSVDSDNFAAFSRIINTTVYPRFHMWGCIAERVWRLKGGLMVSAKFFLSHSCWWLSSTLGEPLAPACPLPWRVGHKVGMCSSLTPSLLSTTILPTFLVFLSTPPQTNYGYSAGVRSHQVGNEPSRQTHFGAL